MNKEDTGKREEAAERLTWEEIRERYPDQWVACPRWNMWMMMGAMWNPLLLFVG